ncbi:H-type small acid-soluble spore protein [Gracilibacillus sp. S3-1-1]|uniref:H-type small acid-soluble spore protein n=1 Tax=Gracilibacillus pellucidus TaxID=3095368 RepID=A0ACC6M4T9_9BACI|nr:H-type small acid-soluble spore protein [Gracilibacillus sp. S3-1-1]MDX8045923.1 H-type small acid-soluble spore protein [Gracilibacillus sp. S3-1-1]
MDAQRAQEILEANEMKNVMYNGEQVYIEHVDQGTGNVTVHPLDNPGEKMMVTVDQLQEH